MDLYESLITSKSDFVLLLSDGLLCLVFVIVFFFGSSLYVSECVCTQMLEFVCLRVCVRSCLRSSSSSFSPA